MVKAVESAGIPVTHICTITPISKTVGAVRIIGAVAIPYPIGDPALPEDKEQEKRVKLVEKALDLLKKDY
ncbi:glycine reductase [Geosporobacter ferrireducens]|uniref:Glycine reductase n=1 Tax=Geosporobacter ferrireducens TaxID=1424294 RepID=A0A1D8GE74_9FIRM|nr:glycine reductase [Geosporobacter ferrireducens]